MSKAPARELRFFANKNTGKIEIVMIADGLAIGSIEYSQEQAESFARQLVAAIEIVNAHRAKPKLIIPEAVH